MGYFYMGYAACKTVHGARNLAMRHSGMIFSFSDDELCRIRVDAPSEESRMEDGSVVFWPTNVTESGITSEQDARRATEFANIFYALMRNDAEFEWAATGVEVGDWLTTEELIERLKTEEFSEAHTRKAYQGLIVSNALYKHVKDEGPWKAFNQSHWWIPFTREVFKA